MRQNVSQPYPAPPALPFSPSAGGGAWGQNSKKAVYQGGRWKWVSPLCEGCQRAPGALEQLGAGLEVPMSATERAPAVPWPPKYGNILPYVL